MATTPRTLRGDQRAMTRQRLLDSGRTLFTSQGYTGTSAEQIASAAGASRATFYLHFSGKPELLSTIFQDAHIKPVMDLIETLGKIEPTDTKALRGWINSYAKFYKQTKALMRAWMQAESQEGSELRKLNDQVLLAIVDTLAEQITATHSEGSAMPKSEARLRAMLMFAELERFCYYVNIRHMTYPKERALDLIATSWANLIALPLPHD